MRVRIIAFLFFISFSKTTDAQLVKFYAEPMAGIHYFHKIQANENIIKKQGLMALYGIKSSISFADILSLNLTKGWAAIGEPELFFQATTRVNFYKPKKYLTVFAESGLQFLEFEGFETPFYLGLTNKEGTVFSWITRVKIPTGFDTHLFKISDSYSFGFELGLQINILPNPPPKAITRFGNPFILI